MIQSDEQENDLSIQPPRVQRKDLGGKSIIQAMSSRLEWSDVTRNVYDIEVDIRTSFETTHHKLTIDPPAPGDGLKFSDGLRIFIARKLLNFPK